MFLILTGGVYTEIFWEEKGNTTTCNDLIVTAHRQVHSLCSSSVLRSHLLSNYSCFLLRAFFISIDNQFWLLANYHRFFWFIRVTLVGQLNHARTHISLIKNMFLTFIHTGTDTTVWGPTMVKPSYEVQTNRATFNFTVWIPMHMWSQA